MKRIILASDSPEIKNTLNKRDIPFEIQLSTYVVNVSQDLHPEYLVKLYSLGKAKEVSETNPNSIVIGAESLIHYNDKTFKWPESKEELKQILQLLNGKSFSIFFGYTVIDNFINKTISKSHEEKINLKNIPNDEIEENINRTDHQSIASGFYLLGPAKELIENKENDDIRKFDSYQNSLSENLKELVADSYGKHSDSVYMDIGKGDEPAKNQPQNDRGLRNYSESNEKDDRPNYINAYKNTASNNDKQNEERENNKLKSTDFADEFKYSEDRQNEKSKDIYNHLSYSSDNHTSQEDRKNVINKNPSFQNKDQVKSEDYRFSEEEKKKQPKGLIKKIRREKNPAEIERERNLKRKLRHAKRSDSDSEKSKSFDRGDDEKDYDNVRKGKKKKESRKKESDGSILSGFFSIVRAVFGQDLLVRFVVTLIAGIFAFYLIFKWMGFLSGQQ